MNGKDDAPKLYAKGCKIIKLRVMNPRAEDSAVVLAKEGFMVKSLDIIDPKRDEPTPVENNEEAEGDDIRVKESGGGGVFYLVLGIIAVVVATAAALYILYKDKPATDSNKAGVISTLTATQSTTAESSATVASTTTATSLATAVSSTFKYTSESIRVANGNGISGEGAKIKKILEDAGFKVASVGNANKNYDQTVIFYKNGQKNLAEALKSAINSKYTAELTESDSTVGTYDAVIALGAK